MRPYAEMRMKIHGTGYWYEVSEEDGSVTLSYTEVDRDEVSLHVTMAPDDVEAVADALLAVHRNAKREEERSSPSPPAERSDR